MIPSGIANSSPFIGLGRIGRLDLIEGQFERLIVPEAVASEVGHLPISVQVEKVSQPVALAAFPHRIHRGEAEVILLGLESPESVLVIDDWFAREFAVRRGLKVMGTIGLLLRSKQTGRVPKVTPLLDQLASVGFRLSVSVLTNAKRLAGEL